MPVKKQSHCNIKMLVVFNFFLSILPSLLYEKHQHQQINQPTEQTKISKPKKPQKLAPTKSPKYFNTFFSCILPHNLPILLMTCKKGKCIKNLIKKKS